MFAVMSFLCLSITHVVASKLQCSAGQQCRGSVSASMLQIRSPHESHGAMATASAAQVFMVDLTVTSCENSSWNGKYSWVKGESRWEKDATHHVYKYGGKWRIAAFQVQVYAYETSTPSAGSPDQATFEKGCTVQATGFTRSDAEAYCAQQGSDWKIEYTDTARGSLYCLKGSNSTASNCGTCSTYRIVVWKDGGGETQHTPSLYPYSTQAGNVYPGFTPCDSDSLGSPCDSFQATGFTRSDAEAYCAQLGSDWNIKYIDTARGSLYCLKGSNSTASNCGNCSTYRIVVWKDGGGETQHTPSLYPYSTQAGIVYPGFAPCDSDTLGSPCDSFQTLPPTQSPAPTEASPGGKEKVTSSLKGVDTV